MNDVQILGALVDDYVTMLGATGDLACVEEVKPLFYASAGTTVASVGLGLFGVYKLFKGKPAAGVTGFVAAALSLGVSRVLAGTMAAKLEACKAGVPVEQPKLPAA